MVPDGSVASQAALEHAGQHWYATINVVVDPHLALARMESPDSAGVLNECPLPGSRRGEEEGIQLGIVESLADGSPVATSTASAVTHVVRLGAWAAGPLLGGLLLTGAPLVASLIVGAGLKIVYDLLLYSAFRRIEPPEERSRRGA
jgi:hypothetical protein